MQIRQTMTPDSGNAAQPDYDRPAATACRESDSSRYLAGPPMEAQEIEPGAG